MSSAGKSTGGIELFSPTYFMHCGVAGVLSCGLTHAAVTPLDVVKCNAQARPELFPKGFFGNAKIMMSGKYAAEGYPAGARILLKGWGPTLLGYGIQGSFKFGLYETFKHLLTSSMSEERAYTLRDGIRLVSSASAEFFADAAYVPFEAVKVRVQTQPTFAKGMMDGIPKMVAQEGVGNLYASINALWARQIPYTIIKFMAFERIAEVFYGLAPKKKEDMTRVEQMGVVFCSGYTAGVICGAVSHPADTLVSKINAIKMEGSFMQKSKAIYGEIGMAGLWKGFGPRVIMIGTLTGLQWFIYGAYKSAVGLPTPGAAAKPIKKSA